MRMHRRSPADDRADPRTNSLAPDPAPREHGSCTIQITHIQYPIQQSITYNANSHYPKHPPWPLPRSASGMRPRGLSRQRNGEGCTWTVGVRGRGGGGCFGRRDRRVAGDWVNHWLGMDALRNHQGMVAAHANRFQGLAISASQNVVNLKGMAIHAIQFCCT